MQHTDGRRSASSFVDRYGPWALVTGASDGIGKEFARALADRGLNVVLVARRGWALEELANELSAAHAIDCRVIADDLSDADAVERLVAATSDLDIGMVVAAAGFGTSGPLIHASLAVEAEMVAVNCTAALALAWHFGAKLSARGRGGLVLMSSLVGFAGVPRAANYAATKAYVQTLAEGLRHEFALQGVDVIASAPGPVRSGFGDRADMQMSGAAPASVVARATLRALGRRTTVRPGALSKLLGWSLAAAPRAVRVRILGRVMGGMTAHQSDGHKGGRQDRYPEA